MNKIVSNKREIIAQTFTPLYDEIEDRIRVVINYQDMANRVDFMITRSFILNLVPTIDEFILKHYHNQLEVEDHITLNADHKEQKDKNISKTDNTNLELLKTEEQLLVKVDLSYDAESKKTLFVLYSKNHTIAKALLDGHILQQVFKIIKKSIPHFRWGISHNF